nr:CUB and sushi domain-containing protein 3-like isoform X2 [Crassostrea gigas]
MNAAILFKIIVVWNLCSELVAIDNMQYEDGISGQITSPGYPGNYPNHVNYTWIIRTGSRSANVTFRIIEMNIEKWRRPCDDYLEIMEIEPCCHRLFKQCGSLKNTNIYGRGNEIRVSFISDKSMTEKGFNLTWKVTLPPTTTKKYMVKTSKKMDVKTTVFQNTNSPSSSQVTSAVQATLTSALGTTEYTTTSSTLIPESPSTVKKSGRATSPPITSEQLSSLSIQYSETKQTTLQKRSRPLTLSSTTRSSSVELTSLDFNATTEKEDKNTFDIQTVYLITGSVVFEFFLLLVACVSIYRCRNKSRSLQKNQCQQKRDEGARNFVNGAYWKSVHVYDTIPLDAVCGLETCPEETNEDIEEHSKLYDKCWRNEHDRAHPAMDEDNRDNAHTYETCERFYFTLQKTHPSTPPATPTPIQRDSTNFYHTVDNLSLPK